MILGLDWDDTITTYCDGLTIIALRAQEVHIITLNNAITVAIAEAHLCTAVEAVHHMPDSAFDTSLEDVGVGKWKAAKCKELGVHLMIDDMANVVDCCNAAGVASIQVQLRD